MMAHEARTTMTIEVKGDKFPSEQAWAGYLREIADQIIMGTGIDYSRLDSGLTAGEGTIFDGVRWNVDGN